MYFVTLHRVQIIAYSFAMTLEHTKNAIFNSNSDKEYQLIPGGS
jgi:hypothetical protein